MYDIEANFKADVEAITGIDAVPSILEVICRTTGMGFAAVARVTPDKWIACAVRDEIEFGLVPGGELQVESTICHEIRQNHAAVVIDHVDEDEVYAHHHTPEMYGFQSYISMPIMLKDGSFYGTLCAIDPKPARLNNPETIGMFKLFAELIAFHLNAIDQLNISQSNLLEERKTAELRDQFIAILGHDLRNPVGAVSNVAQILLRMPLDERIKRLATIIQDSSFRMKGLIDNILDFASGKLGGGITLNRDNESLEQVLTQVLTELKLIWPERTINIQFNLAEPVNCDSKRIAQLFSNLLSNAITHGKKDAPVSVTAVSDKKEFVLAINNAGDKIPDNVIEHLFQPFSRGEAGSSKQGLGLGLFIASEIANAHGGTLTVCSTDDNTCFTLQIPA
ncbi:GAF domain-containing sensor histidine kinase [Mucilaginibacter aquaedulcis]|uniref:GAF domain-containing sensor histidine kinase n=1 Tax=Mucilaginibacter aquaedulcis TaxID=1187081 RepID=UPI0025B5B13D|nr:GAF domain-containing sensor histidine kinase [Mucilaginibacter aquaedulcis]MDN3549275.1 GAF domain-containing sensor histidine kinase [Mucilaginibacter aquaedulcis]